MTIIEDIYKAIRDLETTIVCHPDNEEAVREAAERFPLTTVQVSPYVKYGQILSMPTHFDPGPFSVND